MNKFPFPKEEALPLIPLRDVVVYPEMVIPLFVGREKSVKAIETSVDMTGKQILLVAQHEASIDDPENDELYSVGTLAHILQMLKLPDGTLKILVEGLHRVNLDNFQLIDDQYLVANYQQAEEIFPEENDASIQLKTLKQELVDYADSSKKLPKEVLTSLSEINELGLLIDSIATHLSVELAQKQDILEIADISERNERLLGLLDIQSDVQNVDRKIRTRVKKQMEKSQREYYLNEQMKAIQKELGDIDGGVNELDELETKITDAKMSESANKKAMSELGKMKMMSPMSAEASVLRNYIDCLISVPWHKKTRLKHDLKKAEQILENDHYGLEEVKERILEFLAVQKRVKTLKGPILCLVGPPGVGKTSLGESIAKATNRKFVRMSLGGVRDESEIRGHRRTYIGSMPGKIVQKLTKVEVKNHYLEVDYDLSEVMFVCTANSMNIPGPLLDRMEVIRIPGYTEDEKVAIADRYLLPRQEKDNGLAKKELEIEDNVLRNVIRHYTREAGVRGFDREIAKLCRKVVMKNSLKKKTESVLVDESNLSDFLGVQKFSYGVAEEQNRIGQVTGLAWTQVGGEILTIEASSVSGNGKVIKTGSLGDVMQESIQAALTVVRSRSRSLGIAPDFHANKDLHIHVPEGATPKDGPSAGVGMATALVSELTSIPVRSDVAMTGEITLRGEVLAIGGVKEKLLAAHRAGIKTVIIPEENEKNLSEVPDNIKNDLNIQSAKWIEQVLEIALESIPVALDEVSENTKEVENGVKSRPSTH